MHFMLKRHNISVRFWILTTFLVLVFLIGGSARADVQSLIVLRPVAVLLCGAGLLTLTRDDVQRYRFLFILTAAIFALVGLHLVPMPSAFWSGLPGRGIIAEVDHAAGLGEVWRPISMVPSATWNALYSLFVPLAILLIGAQLPREDQYRLLYPILALGLFSGLIGLVQVVGAPGSALYFYRITNTGSAVGLFANRNHAAALLVCLLPILAVYASARIRTVEQANFRRWAAVAVGAVLVPLILVTGSRAGIVTAFLGLGLAALIYRAPKIEKPAKRKIAKFNMTAVVSGIGVTVLALLTALFSRAEALERLMASDQTEDLRFQIWSPIATMIWKYLPIGSGIGSFVEVFQLDEPFDVLTPNYVNHAHNDWLEIALTGGIPALLILAVAIMAFARQTYAAWRASDARRPDVLYGRMASALFLLIALASVSDYPARVPSLMCLMAVAALWLIPSGHGYAKAKST